MKRSIDIYSDGSLNHGNGRSAWAYNIVEGDEVIYSSHGPGTSSDTSNTLELISALHGLQKVIDEGMAKDLITVFSSSAYLVNCFKDRWFDKWIGNGWVNAKGNPVANRNLWEELIEIYSTLHVRFVYSRVKDKKFLYETNKRSKDFIRRGRMQHIG